MADDHEGWLSSDLDEGPSGDEPFVRSPIAMIMGATWVLLVSTVVFLLIRGNDPAQDSSLEGGATTAATIDGATVSTEAAEAEVADGEPATGVEGPYVEATLDANDFVLRGVVPSAALAGSYLRAAEIAYSPYVRSELMVDEQLDPVEWLDSGPEAIVLLPMITDGTILIADGQVDVSGRAPDSAGVQRLEGALGQVTGLPVVLGEMTITDLAAPSLLLQAEGGRIVVSGQLPTEELHTMMVDGAIAAYGDANVEDRITVDAGVYPSLWMYNGGPLLQAMSVFPDYELRVDGTAFSGFINGGVTFEPGSADFTGSYAQVLDVGVSVLTRDQSLQLVIEGHTDSSGSDAVNLELSQRRAEAVMDYFVVNGIDPDRLTAIGKGETEPVVPNDSEEGRARNRRIQYILSS